MAAGRGGLMHVLITGATGYLGSQVARELAGTAPLILHARRPGESIDGAEWHSGDLERDDAFASMSPETVTHIVHSGAVTRFNVEKDLAQRVNVDGTRRLLEFARQCPKLQHVLLVSTVYSSGLRTGAITETLHEDAGFANHYEASKWQAENLFAGEFDDLPWSIVRICTVIADDAGGRSGTFNAVHNTLRLLYYGLLSVVPGDAATTLYFVDRDFTVQALLALLNQGAGGGVFHVSPRADDSPTLGSFIETVFDIYSADPSFRLRRVMKPLPCDLETFQLMADAAASTGGMLGEALASIAPFARQLFAGKELANDNLRTAIGHDVPPSQVLVENMCRKLLETRFGRS